MNCWKWLEGFYSCSTSCNNWSICRIMSDNIKEVLSANKDKWTNEVISITPQQEAEMVAIAQQ